MNFFEGFQSTHLLVDRRCEIMRSRNDCSSIYNIQNQTLVKKKLFLISISCNQIVKGT